MNNARRPSLIPFLFILLGSSIPALAEVELIATKDYIFSISPYLRIDAVTLKNNIDLDSKKSKVI